MRTIPIRLQEKEFRFVTLGYPLHWKSNTTNKIISAECTAENYKKMLSDGCTPMGKAPICKDWQTTNNYAYDNPKISAILASQRNIGIIAGYGNLRIIDADNTEFAKELKKILPTFTVKTGSGGAHFYIKSDYKTNHTLTKNGQKIGEYRAEREQVVIPGSLHPSGKHYDVETDVPILELSTEDTKKILAPYNKATQNNANQIPQKETDTTRSGQEFREICKLIKNGIKNKNIDKDWIFNQMNFFSKWKESSTQYREHTWKKAYETVITQKETEKPLKNTADTGQRTLKLTSYIDNVEKFYHQQPFFYDKNCIFWLWDKKNKMWQITDETDIMNSIDAELNFGGETVTSNLKNSYLEAFKRVGRKHLPIQMPKTCIQFKDTILDVITGEEKKSNPQFFLTNPIPWEIGQKEETPIIDKLFSEWVAKEDIPLLYEIIGYCCLPDYPLHRIFVLIGSGANGKGCFQELIKRVIGQQNICSSELDLLLNNRFETAKLYKKLVCSVGETNYTGLRKTSLLKKLSGQDTIGYEFKNKKPFDDYNYAKIIINTNSLPTTSDRTTGFYRRFQIIDFPNTFTEKKDILNDIPPIEFNNLAKKSIRILKDLLKKREFTNEGTFEQRKERYEEKSNPIRKYIQENCIIDINKSMPFADFFDALTEYLADRGYRNLTLKEVSYWLNSNGFPTKNKTIKKPDGSNTSANYVFGLCLQSIDSIDSIDNSTLFPYIETNRKMDTIDTMDTTNPKNKHNKALMFCENCKIMPGKVPIFLVNNRYLCEPCARAHLTKEETIE